MRFGVNVESLMVIAPLPEMAMGPSTATFFNCSGS